MDKRERLLKNWIYEILEDIDLFGINQVVVLFYKNKFDGKHFSDYKVINEKVPAPIYDDENAEAVSLKELLFIIADLLYPNVSDEVRTIWVNMWLQDCSQYKLAKALGVSKQFVHMMLNNISPIPDDKYEKISEVLHFDMEEYFRIKSNYKFDETDL